MIIPIFIIFYLGHKFIKKTHLVPLKDCDFEQH
jgi:amino acid permease